MKTIIKTIMIIIFAIPVFGAGGISSGGGGTLPANPIFPNDVYNIIVEQAKRDLRLLLNIESIRYDGPSDYATYKEKIFGGTVTILDLLESTDIEIRLKEPCYDANGEAVDGSIYSNQINSICISAHATAPKLIKERARKEILALIVHELSHLLGTDEDEARQLQEDVLYSLDRTLDHTSKLLLDNAEEKTNFLRAHFSRILKAIDDGGSWDSIDNLMDMLFMDYYSSIGSLGNSEYQALKKNDYDFYNIQRTILDLMVQFTSSKSSKKDSEYWKKSYDNIFKNETSVAFGKIFKYNMENTYHDFVIHKIQNKNDLKKVLIELDNYFLHLSNYIFNLKSDLALYPLPNPMTMSQVNPWEKYTGTFTIQKVECTRDGVNTKDDNLDKIEFFKNEQGNMSAKFFRQQSWFVQHLYDGAGDVTAGSSVHVSGTQSSATRTAELGHAWARRWIHSSWELSQNEQDFVFTQKHINSERDGYDGTRKYFTYSCTFKGDWVAQ